MTKKVFISNSSALGSIRVTARSDSDEAAFL